MDSLQSDIKKFADGLPYWGKILAKKILSNKDIDNADIEEAYTVLLEELNISPQTKREKIGFTFEKVTSGYHADLRFESLKNVTGVNALAEDQILNVCGNLTVVYGVNGSGKSGYGRLLKQLFYSKSREEIIPNIHVEKGHKKTAAVFGFSSGDQKFDLKYPEDKGNLVFNQFSVFDGKSVLSHLDERNVLSFRPAGLSFFSYYTEAVKKLESKLNEEIRARQGINPFTDLFEGDSEIKVLINGLSANSKMEKLKSYLPFTEKDKEEKKSAEKEYDDLFVASRGKDQEVKKLEGIKQSLKQTSVKIGNLNKYFSTEALDKIHSLILGCIEKEKIAKAEGIENFETDKFKEIGSTAWKNFIIAAQVFAEKQQEGEKDYPEPGDYCLLCRQEISKEGLELIQKYWAFIKSEAEKDSVAANALVQGAIQKFEMLDFELFPEQNMLTIWMTEKQGEHLGKLVNELRSMRSLSIDVIQDLQKKVATKRSAFSVNTSAIDAILNQIDESLKKLREDEQQKELERKLQVKTLYAHREKLSQRIDDIEAFVSKQIWINKASRANWGKRAITDTEKALSSKYFNQKYIYTFNEECRLLDGSFDIEVNHTGTAGASYRQLFLKGKVPSSVLSEGEQKVIALADFIAEMRMSEINRGMVFDDPVNSLDEYRKKKIAEHLVELSKTKQIIIFSHDLVFVSALISHCEDSKIEFESHWIEKREKKPGMIFLNNAPSYEKEYRNSNIPLKYYSDAKKDSCPPGQREFLISQGFTALRTCYEALVIFELFSGVVQRFTERVSVDSLKSVNFDRTLVDELLESYGLCCRYMEGHLHSDTYAYKKPELKDLKEEIDRYEIIKKKIKDAKKVLAS